MGKTLIINGTAEEREEEREVKDEVWKDEGKL